MKQDRQKIWRTTIECLLCAPRLTEYVDGRLSEATTWRIRNHVAVCESCAARVQSFSSITSLLGSVQKLQTTSVFDNELARRIAALPSKRNALGRKQLHSLLSGASIGFVSSRTFAGPIALAVVGVAFIGLAFESHTPQSMQLPTRPALAVAASEPDSTLVETCINQHRAADSSDPLDDTSAVLLTTRVDALPVAPNQNQNLNNDDAAVLLDEGM